jgi:hypothetical protein
MTSAFFRFSQNNSGGSFFEDEAIGLGPEVYIEANSPDHANERAESIGIYFDGVEDDIDCSCCGDRWYRVWGDDRGVASPANEFPSRWRPRAYVHHLDGRITTFEYDQT